MPPSSQVLQNARYDKEEVFWERENITIQYVFCELPTLGWVPWTVVAPSAILNRNGIRANGLYAARSFTNGRVVGHYPRTQTWQFDSRQDQNLIDFARQLVLSGSDKLITVRNYPSGVLLVDGSGGGNAEVQMVNDPKGTRLHANATIGPTGIMKVVASSVPAFCLDKSLDENIRSELRIDYGEDFWQLIDAAGTTPANAYIVT